MHSYLRAIGLKSITTQQNEEDMVCDVIGNANRREYYEREDGSRYIEYTMEMSESFGVKVRGEEDSEHRFHFSHFCPYVLGTFENKEEEIFVDKRVDTEAYTGMCDDFRIGVSLIFYIQNNIDYLNKFKGENVLNGASVFISGLSTEGKILLPTSVREESTEEKFRQMVDKYKNLYKAKQGDQQAIENLTLEDIDKYAIVSERIKNEDLFSIVETSFVPFGSESDVYNIVGNIVGIDTERNKISNEKVYILEIECNSILLNIAINSKDLMGEPDIGRRFRGTVWLQGRIEQAFGKLIP